MTTTAPQPSGAQLADIERSYSNAVDHFLNSVTEAFALIDREGRVLRANIAYRRLTGPAGGAHDASILSYLEAERRDAAREAILSLGVTNPSRSLHLRFKIGNQIRVIDADMAWLNDGGCIAFVGRDMTRQDILERERIETATARDAVEQIGNIGHWRSGRDFKLQFSAGAARILGLDPAAPPLVLTDLVEMIQAEDRAGAVAAAREAFQARKPLNYTCRVRRPDGGVRMVQVAGSVSMDAGGQVDAVHGVLVDKSDAHAALQAALNADSTVRRFVHASPMAIVMYDKDLRVMMASRSWLCQRELKEEEALGRSLFELMPWTPEKWRTTLRQCLRGEAQKHDRDSFETSDGKARWLKWACAPWRDGSGDIGGVVVMHEDVTDMVNAQHEVEASRERMAFGLAMTSTMIWELDFEKREVQVEGDWTQFFPQKPTFASFTGDESWIHPADREMMASKWKAHYAGGPPYAVDFRIIRADGSEKWQSASVRILKSVKGSPARAFGVVQDVTGRKQMESKTMAAEQRALIAAAAKTDFLSNMSHEIRTPLNGVLAVSEMLNRTQLDSKQAEMVKMITTSGATLLRVMDDLVEFSRLEGDQIEFEIRPFDLEETLRQTCEAARSRAESKGLRFDSFISANVDGIYRGDPVRVSQVLGNLLNNAVKFTDAGHIEVSASVEEAATGATKLTVTITDTGIGFGADVADRIFDRFEQADISTSRKYGGLGLGLSIVKRLVEMMNGTVKATSKQGEGSTFEVMMPLSRDRIAALAPLAAVAVEDFDTETTVGNLRLLVAEDNPMNRRVVELLLANSGMQITFAENGKEAVAKFADGKFDIVLMDLQMPIMGGLAATKAIREWEKTNARMPTPIIAVSANATNEHVDEAKEAGADDHVAKPIVRESLFEAIARYARPAARAAKATDDDIEFDLDDLDIAI